MSQPTVIIFSTPRFLRCTNTKDYLKIKNNTLKEIGVSGVAKAAQDIFSKSGQGSVPQLRMGVKTVVRSDKKKIEKVFKHKQGVTK